LVPFYQLQLGRVELLDQITPLILTYNEAPNIGRTLAKLGWAKRIVVIDSGSTDGTLDLLHRHSQVEVFHRPFEDFAIQCNVGLTLITGAWVLSLDADYELSDALINELAALCPGDTTAGYRARFVYRVHGRALRGTLYPPRTVLYRRDHGAYRQQGHGHRVFLDGPVLPLRGVIYHDDRKPLSRWFVSQQRYARDEAAHLLACGGGRLGRADRLRLMAWPAPLAVFCYTLFVKRCLFDGWPGWFYALQRLLAEILLTLELIDRRSKLRDKDRLPTG
jgi:glycosyltransferase involved in cell wall biosynthesis